MSSQLPNHENRRALFFIFKSEVFYPHNIIPTLQYKVFESSSYEPDKYCQKNLQPSLDFHSVKIKKVLDLIFHGLL